MTRTKINGVVHTQGGNAHIRIGTLLRSRVRGGSKGADSRKAIQIA